MKTTKQVINQYMEGFETGNVDQVMNVFDETSLIICGANVYRGLKEILDFFKYIMSEVLPPNVKINGIHETIEDRVAYFIWPRNRQNVKLVWVWIQCLLRME
jgi:hypothetical protein